MDKDILASVRQALKDNVDEKTFNNFDRVFKEKVTFYGVKVPTVNKISKEHFQYIKDLPKKEIFGLCEELWKSGYSEESYVACNWSYYIYKQYTPDDFAVFERWVNLYVNNWASCDTLCNHTIGDLVMMYPEYVQNLKVWAKSENRWVKRGAAVTLIIPARKGLFLDDIFEIAETLLMDKDDLVQKGYGWMLKAASESYQREVFDFVVSKKDVMPRTALRYAIEKMPKELKAEAMKK
ncbi:DNA alkylation repair protein [Paludibacter sp. 221]|uniref:DNA alkylation repair protein n=1 Tax=Paludibacter sp. 221 TaxID=2302939 RepID=UPI0013D59437|nr:DNA alkylation repair protein [Paludibacter sp. 221]NDV47471.1 DNA alkylation repair protein [Paludibacter sp. 221]